MLELMSCYGIYQSRASKRYNHDFAILFADYTAITLEILHQ